MVVHSFRACLFSDFYPIRIYCYIIKRLEPDYPQGYNNQGQGFPLEFYFRGHKSPLTLIQGDILGDFRGQSYEA